MAKATRHVPYLPRPGYELLKSTGLRRFPHCTRAAVAVLIPPPLRAWFPSLAHMKVEVPLLLTTVN